MWTLPKAPMVMMRRFHICCQTQVALHNLIGWRSKETRRAIASCVGVHTLSRCKSPAVIYSESSIPSICPHRTNSSVRKYALHSGGGLDAPYTSAYHGFIYVLIFVLTPVYYTSINAISIAMLCFKHALGRMCLTCAASHSSIALCFMRTQRLRRATSRYQIPAYHMYYFQGTS
jgi:hypothetical protein